MKNQLVILVGLLALASGFGTTFSQNRHLDTSVRGVQAANTVIPLYDSICLQYLDTVTNEWINRNRITGFVYNAHYKETSLVGQHWKGGAWENSSKDSISYEDFNLETYRSTMSWTEEGEWMETERAWHTYNANHNLTSYTKQVLFDFYPLWITMDSTTYAYDANNCKIASLLQQKVMSATSAGTTTTIDVSGMPVGIYLLKATTNGKEAMRTFIRR